MQTAAGLASAHAQGLVHRDVKPANILLEDGVERVRLTDFGLARAAVEGSLTRSGVVAGTPHYMAPEQARGETVDQRADLFSLGSTMYAMCAGHPPFRADSALAVLKRVCDNEPRPLLEVNPEMPAWLQAILAKLMAKDTANRFQTAGEVHDLLERCLAHVQQPLALPLPSDPILHQSGPVRRQPGGRRMAIAACLILAAGTASMVWWNGDRKTGTQKDSPDVSHIDQFAEIPSFDWQANPRDELALQITAAQEKAQAVESSLYRRESQHEDQVDKMLRELALQAQALERELAAGQTTGLFNPYYQVPSNPIDRR
jgi:serine/threonine protein kinase